MPWLICTLVYISIFTDLTIIMLYDFLYLHSSPIFNLQDSSYSKCSKILNTFLILFSNKRVKIFKILVRIANREDPDQSVNTDQLNSCIPCSYKPKIVNNRILSDSLLGNIKTESEY